MSRLLLAASMAVLIAAPAFAQDYTLEADIGATSDYRYRGISRSDESPAVQGGVQYNHSSGFFAGVDASSVDLNIDNDANVEAVLFGGLKTDYDGIDVTGKLSYTAYPGGDDDLDYWELMFTGGYDFDVFYGSLTWAFSPEFMNESGMSFYYGADLAAPLPIGYGNFTAKAHLGFQFIEDENRYAEDYIDWSMGIWYNWDTYGIDFGLQYIDTNIDDNNCLEECGGRAVVSATKSFGW